VSAHDDVEGQIYERLYGAREADDGDRRTLGADDPLPFPSEGEPGEHPIGRQGIAAALAARARQWRAERSARRYPGVVAPRPSLARALALIALGVALLAVGALGTFVPDRPSDEGLMADGSPPPRASEDARASEARERAADRRRAERRARRERVRARERRRRAASQEASSKRSVRTVPMRTVRRASAPPAPTYSSPGVLCVEGGGCYAPAPSTGGASSPEEVVIEGDVGGPDLSAPGLGGSGDEGSPGADASEVVVESVVP